MLKNLKYLLIGIYFGIVLVKSEVVSWFRIQELFRFDSLHMYGVIGSAAVIGVISIFLIRHFNIRSMVESEIIIKPKVFNKKGNIIGGIVFGLGWDLTGACPGPLFAIVGAGYSFLLVVILGATIVTLTYGYSKNYLPH